MSKTDALHLKIAHFNAHLGNCIRKLFSSSRSNQSYKKMCAQHNTLYQCLLSLLHSDHSAFRLLLNHTFNNWLSGSAIESGASAFLCTVLLHESRANEAIPAALFSHIFLDALLKPCSENIQCLKQNNSACQIECSSRWALLLPYIRRLLRQCSVESLSFDSWKSTSTHRKLSHCAYAHTYGLEKLLVEPFVYEDTKMLEAAPALQAFAELVISFVFEYQIFPSSQQLEKHLNQELNHCDAFYAKLFPKLKMAITALKDPQSIFTEIQKSYIIHLENIALKADTQSFGLEILSIVAVACGTISTKFIKQVTKKYLEILSQISMDSGNLHSVAMILTGIASHDQDLDIKIVPLILTQYTRLLQQYVSMPSHQAHHLQNSAIDVLFLLVYLAIHRDPGDKQRQSIVTFRQQFLHLIVAPKSMELYEILDSSMLFSMETRRLFWKRWFGIQYFKEENGAASSVDELNTRKKLEQLLSSIPLRSLHHWPKLKNFVQTAPLLPILATKQEVIVQQRLRRNRSNIHLLSLSDEILENIVRYCTANGLCCLMATNSQLYALINIPFGRVWRELCISKFLKFDDCMHTPLKRKYHSSKVICTHGSEYRHNWKALYENWYRSRVRLAQRICQSKDLSATICSVCGCHRLLKSKEDMEKHLKLHADFRCPKRTCRASFSSKTGLMSHSLGHKRQRSDTIE